MARGQEAKLRRRQNRKKGDDDDEVFGEGDGDDDGDGVPLSPKMQQQSKKGKVVVEDVISSDEEGEDNDMPIKRSKAKGKKSRKATAAAAGAAAASSGTIGGMGIKTGPLILLILMGGSTIIPALIFASDYLGAFMAKSNVLGQIGFRLGIGSVPRKRVLSFYEKHAPEKLDDVPTILAKHYGDYPTLVKKLERKYHDYGYFIGWQEDEAPIAMAKETVRDLYHKWITQYWNRYAPQVLKTAFRNIRYNLNNLYKKFRKIWKKST